MIKGNGGRTIGAVIFEVRGDERILWTRVEIDSPDGEELAFESSITPVRDFPDPKNS